MPTRRVIPTRRAHTVQTLEHAGRKYLIGFGQECDAFGNVIDKQVLEVFADAKRSGTDMEAFLHDACIAMSLLVQFGCSMEMQAAAYGELRNEGEASGRPASLMGVIARMAVALESS